MAPYGQLLYRDNNHLNILGSQYVGEQVVRQHPEWVSGGGHGTKMRIE
jgi:hypothetical protein